MDEKGSWKRFRRLKFDRDSLGRRVKKAESASTKHAHRFVIRRFASLRDARRHITSWLVLVGLLVVAVGVQMMWSQKSYQTIAPVGGGTYAEGMRGPIRTLNPLYAQTSAEVSATSLIFSSLYDYDSTGHLRDDVAKSVTVDETGKIYTVKIKQGIKWHDGQNLTSEDIAFTVNMMKDPDARSVMRSSWASVNVATPDLETVTFTLPSAYAPFPHALTFSILPKHLLDTVAPSSLRESTFSISPVGSGPFKLRLLQTIGQDDEKKVVYLSKSSDYYRGAVKLDRFEIHSYASAEDIINALKQRDISAAIDVGGVVANIPKEVFDVESQPIQSAVYALFNTDSPILKDDKVRRALQLGTDTKAVRKTLGYGVQSQDLPFSDKQVESVKLPSVPKEDLAKAKQKLEDAGWLLSGKNKVRTKNSTKLQIKLVSAKDNEYARVAKILKDQWAELGVDVQVTEFDGKNSNQSFAQVVLQPRAYDVLLNELSIGGDADVFAYWHSSQAVSTGLNFSNFNSTVSDDALLSARLRSEKDLRDQKYKVFAEDWIAKVPAIGLYESSMVYAQLPRIRSFEAGSVLPSISDRYANVQYWTTEQAQVYKTP